MFRGLAFHEESLGCHRERSHRMNMSENSTVLAPHHSVAEHAHIRLDQSGLVVSREEFEAERRVNVFDNGSGILPDHFVAAAGVSYTPRCILREFFPLL